MSTTVADQVAEQVWGGAHILAAIEEAGGEAVRIEEEDGMPVTYYRFQDGSEIWVDSGGGWDFPEEDQYATPPIDPRLLGPHTHLFGAGIGWLPVEADEIARRHGARLINAEDPTGRLTSRRVHWFVCRNDSSSLAVERAVLHDLRAAGLLGEDEAQ